MTSILTDSYYEKLNFITNERIIPISLDSVINYFLNELSIDELREKNKSRRLFNTKVIQKIQTIRQTELIKLYKYLNIIIDSYTGQFLHIHININLSDEVLDNLITLFAWNISFDSLYDSILIEKEVEILKKKIEQDIVIPSSNNGHDINKLLKEKNGIKQRLKFLYYLKNSLPISSDKNILLNLNNGKQENVYLTDYNILPQALNSYLNFGDNMQTIYDNKISILSKIDKIINLFPILRGQNVWLQDYIKESVDLWNNDADINFNKIVTITAEEKPLDNLLNMQRDNKFQANEIYTIFPFELQN